MMITLLIAFAVGIVLGKAMLPVLHKLKFGQNIYELAPEAHKKKQGTPTMGGLVIAGAAIAAALVMNDYSVPMGQNMLLAMLLMALGNLCIGFVDDMTKIRKGKNGGLTPRQKMIFQTLLALFFRNFLFFHRVHDILPDLEPWKQGIVLEHKCTVRTWFGNFLAIDHDLSFIRRLEPSDNGQCCGFAAAGRTQKGYKLPF